MPGGNNAASTRAAALGKVVMGEGPFGTVLALSLITFAYWIDPMFFIWSLPVSA